MIVALYKGISPLSRMIRFRTWSEYSHASLYVPRSGEFESWIPNGVRNVSPIGSGHTPGTQVDLFAVTVTPSQEGKILHFLQEQVGKKYDYRGVLGFLSRRDRAQNQDRWFCSELVFAACQAGGIDLLARIQPHRVSPDMLALSPLLEHKSSIKVPNYKERHDHEEEHNPACIIRAFDQGFYPTCPGACPGL